jgi:hypothetical protein
VNSIADMAAIAVFGVGLTATAIWQVLAWQNRRRRKARALAHRVREVELANLRAEFARIVARLDDESASEEDVPTMRTESIELPREGKGES